MTVRTRFAPSPTGELHLGNARTAVLNWLFARHEGGRFVLRFEDTDVERKVAGAEESMREDLDWLGLERDEDPWLGGPHGPYRQSERLELYRSWADRLLEAKLAYRCWCTPEELAARREARMRSGGQPAYDGHCRYLSAAMEESYRAEGRAAAIRFRVDPSPIRFRDRLRGELVVDGSDFGDFVILRSDRRPTYNFAVVVDDHLMRITHVIRGSGHLSNTPKQVLLFRALGVPPPEFVHVPNVLAAEGEKLSKRAGAKGLRRYREEGYHPDAVVNYLSLLSWSTPNGRELLSRDELVRETDLDRLGTSEPMLDPAKMRWLSGQHIRRETPEQLAARIAPWIDRERLAISERDLIALAEIVRPRIHLFSEAGAEARRIFGEPAPGEEAARILQQESSVRVLATVAEAWERLVDWEPESIGEALRSAGRRAGVGGRELYRPVRIALTGHLHGPELPDVAHALGRERCLARLRQATGPEPGKRSIRPAERETGPGGPTEWERHDDGS